MTCRPASRYADFKALLFGPHMLRHVYASLQIERGVTPKRLQKLIGHSSLKMTLDTYGHLNAPENMRRYMQSLSARKPHAVPLDRVSEPRHHLTSPQR